MAITAQAKCTDMPPTGSSQAPGLAARPGSSGPSECSFSLPLRPPRISPVTQGCYKALPMGWEAARTLPPLGAAAGSSSGRLATAQIRDF
jgi:hypothetical protein